MFSEINKYLRLDKLPHIWCPGCGDGIVTAAFLRAVKELDLDRNNTVVVSGIGCSSRASTYLDFNTLHSTHGRALTFATGIKLSKPKLKVFVIMGDGDCGAIGGNHLLHAARRNIDLTAIVFNNSIYGMTGGQYSPSTPIEAKATTAPYGNIERAFDLTEIAKTAGATYVGRATTYHSHLITKLIVEGAKNKGFSFIEAVTSCPTYYGRYNKAGSPADMVRWQKDNFIVKKKDNSQKLKEGQFLVGELYKSSAPEYCEQYDKIILSAKQRGE